MVRKTRAAPNRLHDGLCFIVALAVLVAIVFCSGCSTTPGQMEPLDMTGRCGGVYGPQAAMGMAAMIDTEETE